MAEVQAEDIVIVGASLAGMRAAQALRDDGYDGRLTIVGAETHLPYDRPPLSKQLLLGPGPPEPQWLEEPGEMLALANWRLGVRATALDGAHREVHLDTGERLRYGRLLIATGAVPRSIPATPPFAGIHLLRTFEDCEAIRKGFDRGARVAVVGGGFIGSEVAAAARSRGLDVTLIEALPQPLARVLGPAIGVACTELHRQHGVEVLTGVGVAGFEGDGGRVTGVRLADGRVVPADLVVVGIGVTPATGWLEGSGIDLRDGVVCDQMCESSIPGVFAAGDIARWHNPLFDEEMRVEHWTNAVEQGMAAAANMLRPAASRIPFAPVPYVWSDQYDVNIRIAGRVGPGHEVRVVLGSVESLSFTAIYGQADRLTGVLTFGMPMRPLNVYRRLVEQRTSWDEACRAQL